MPDLIPAWINGTLTPTDKLEVHRRGLRHKAVSVFVLSGDHVLIQQRALTKYHTPGLWANTCCTHPHWDEAADNLRPPPPLRRTRPAQTSPSPPLAKSNTAPQSPPT